MTRKTKYLIQTGLFLIIFIGLLLVATFLDLEISHLPKFASKYLYKLKF